MSGKTGRYISLRSTALCSTTVLPRRNASPQTLDSMSTLTPMSALFVL